MSTRPRNLIVSPIGDGSVHRSWLAPGTERTYDLLLIYYGNRSGFGAADATYYLERQGMKCQLLGYALDTLPDVIASYANVWCPDDDIRAAPSDINRLFALFEHYRLQMAQPAIGKGEVSFQVTRPRAGIILRYSPYVEVMCPVFTHRALRRVSSTFVESRSNWGLDIIWPRFFSADEIAIIDDVQVEHTRPLGTGAMYKTLADEQIDPRAELEEVVQRYGRFDPKLHHRLYRGKIKLPAIRHPSTRVNPVTRLAESLGLRRAVA